MTRAGALSMMRPSAGCPGLVGKGRTMKDIDRRRLLGCGAALWATSTVACGGGGDDEPAYEGMAIERDVRVPLRDGGVLSADVFRPKGSARYPVILSVGPYPKSIPFKSWSPADYERQVLKSGQGADDLMHWETALPDDWVPQGYVQVRCDQRGSGESPGRLDLLGPQVQRDYLDAIEWAGTQPWSNGNVGLLGDSYFAAVQWLVAQHQPPHLKAMIAVQGFTDFYRDAMRHGGLLSSRFLDLWFEGRVRQWQHGSARFPASPPLSAAQLAANTVFERDFRQLLRENTLATGSFVNERTPDLSKIRVPVFAYANGGGLGLHGRGTVEGYRGAVNAPMRRLKVGAGQDPDAMYTPAEVEQQRRFFDHHLKGRRNGVDSEPAVTVMVRRGPELIQRQGSDYPLPGTQAVRWNLDLGSQQIGPGLGAEAALLSYAAAYGSAAGMVRLASSPLAADLELIGPLRLHLRLACSGTDTDVFVALRELRPDGSEVTAQGAQDPAVPVAMGWLRASMRKSDPTRSTEFRAWHPYDEARKLSPGVAVELDINLWPTAWIIQKGNRLVLDIGGSEQAGMVTFTHLPAGPWRPDGVAPIDNGASAPCTVTLLSEPGVPNFLVLPVR
jgi:uncharacterized protein